MTTYANNRQHVYVIVIGLVLASSVYLYISGEGSYTLLLFSFNKNLLAKVLAFVSFGLYSRWCYESDILPNEQAIETFLGEQTGEVFKESNIVFVARPLWGIWKRVSVQHFSFTVAAQNRSKEGHSLIVFATGKAIPNNAQLLAKMTQSGVEEQVLGLSMLAIGVYINQNQRETLLQYPQWDVSKHIGTFFENNDLYGLTVKVFTTKVIEENQKTRELFDAKARQGDMEAVLKSIRTSLPNLSEVELFATYASIAGVTPAVMSHVIHGGATNTMILGGGQN
jgi:hypothetical protein